MPKQSSSSFLRALIGATRVFRFGKPGMIAVGMLLAPGLLPSLSAERPAFVTSLSRDILPVPVLGIESLTLADVIIIDGGYEQGYRAGMVCTVSRAGQPIGDVVIVEVRPTLAAAIIQNLADGIFIQPGDFIRPRVVSS